MFAEAQRCTRASRAQAFAPVGTYPCPERSPPQQVAWVPVRSEQTCNNCEGVNMKEPTRVSTTFDTLTGNLRQGASTHPRFKQTSKQSVHSPARHSKVRRELSTLCAPRSPFRTWSMYVNKADRRQGGQETGGLESSLFNPQENPP